jgi:hypothetical protein
MAELAGSEGRLAPLAKALASSAAVTDKAKAEGMEAYRGILPGQFTGVPPPRIQKAIWAPSLSSYVHLAFQEASGDSAVRCDSRDFAFTQNQHLGRLMPHTGMFG